MSWNTDHVDQIKNATREEILSRMLSLPEFQDAWSVRRMTKSNVEVKGNSEYRRPE